MADGDLLAGSPVSLEVAIIAVSIPLVLKGYPRHPMKVDAGQVIAS